MNLTKQELAELMPGYKLPVKKRVPKLSTASLRGHIQSIDDQILVFPEKAEQLKKIRDKFIAENTTELSVHNQLCKYLKHQYPGIMFMSDFGAGMKMGIGMATRQSNQKSRHSYPDVIIFEPRGLFHGLMIEVKKNRDTLYKKSGEIRTNDHFQEQERTINQLKAKGYFATFGCGIDECIQIVNDYMSGFIHEPPIHNFK